MKFGKKAAHSGAKRSLVLVVSVLVLLLAVAGGTLAWLTANTGPVVNTFDPAQVSCKVTEHFDGTTKSNVNVENTSDITAYIRVKLVTYRVNDAGQHIGGTAEIPDFNLGEGWVEHGGYYYYTKPVAPKDPKNPEASDNSPETPLIGGTGIELVNSYNDADGGKQVIEVMAEAIQSVPDTAVKDAWGVNVVDGELTFSTGN